MLSAFVLLALGFLPGFDSFVLGVRINIKFLQIYSLAFLLVGEQVFVFVLGWFCHGIAVVFRLWCFLCAGTFPVGV